MGGAKKRFDSFGSWYYLRDQLSVITVVMQMLLIVNTCLNDIIVK